MYREILLMMRGINVGAMIYWNRGAVAKNAINFPNGLAEKQIEAISMG